MSVIFSMSRCLSVRFFEISIDYSNVIQKNSGYPMWNATSQEKRQEKILLQH